ncbi:MAG: hypothetical protein ACYCO3_16460 [Mycobacteriales bacterium]
MDRLAFWERWAKLQNRLLSRLGLTWAVWWDPEDPRNRSRGRANIEEPPTNVRKLP